VKERNSVFSLEDSMYKPGNTRHIDVIPLSWQRN